MFENVNSRWIKQPRWQVMVAETCSGSTCSQRDLLAGIPARNYSFPRRSGQNLENMKILRRNTLPWDCEERWQAAHKSDTEYQIVPVIMLIFKILHFYLLLYVYELTIVFCSNQMQVKIRRDHSFWKNSLILYFLFIFPKQFTKEN